MGYKKHRQYRLPGYDYSSNGNYFITICIKNKEEFLGKIVNGKIKLSPIGKLTESIWKQIPEKFPNIILGVFQVMPDHFHAIITIKNTNNYIRGNSINHNRENSINHNRRHLINHNRRHLINHNRVDLINHNRVDLINHNRVDLINHNRRHLINHNRVDLINHNRRHLINQMPTDKIYPNANLIRLNNENQIFKSGIKNNPMELKYITLGKIIRWFKGRVKYEAAKINQRFHWQSRYYERIIRNIKEYYAVKNYIINNPGKTIKNK